MGDPSAISGIRENEESTVETEAAEVYKDDPGGDEDFSKKVMAALEKGCKDLGYSLEFMRDMLRSEEKYTRELLDKIKSETGCNEESEIR